MKRETFVVFYRVKGEVRTKSIISTMDDCDKDANKVSKKWYDVILKSRINIEYGLRTL